MDSFKEALRSRMFGAASENFGIENFDQYRFDKYKPVSTTHWTLSKKIKESVKKMIGYDKISYKKQMEKAVLDLAPYEERLEELYKNLDNVDKELVVDIFAYKLAGYTKIKLSRNSKEYWEAIELAKTLKCANGTYDTHFFHFELEKFDLKKIGYDVNFFFMDVGVAIDFIIEQYAYKKDGKTLIQAEKGDTVLDIGGCWGDTALYFAHKAGDTGKVYSFEFIPGNIEWHNKNTALNPHLKKHIELVPNPVSDTTGTTIYFKDNGPGSKIEMTPFADQTGTTTTITIDDFVTKYGVEKVDFIKMDIEGAEPFALKGAIETIKKFRPTLAIAIYHSNDDFVNIPKWILDLDLGYELNIGHYTIHAEETICFAKAKNRN